MTTTLFLEDAVQFVEGDHGVFGPAPESFQRLQYFDPYFLQLFLGHERQIVQGVGDEY
jgi:hypothetical protein